MALFRRIGRSADLVGGMADRLGVPLTGGDPEADARRFSRLTLCCAGCDRQDACASLQAESDRLDAPPDYCRNRGTFAG